MAKINKEIETKDFYECSRCERNSEIDEYCPCPRGSCEAKISGTITITKKINKKLNPEQIKWNKENYR